MSQEWIYTFVFLAWLAGAAAFVLGLHQMNSPATARGGNRLSAGGMTLAVVATLVWLATASPAACQHDGHRHHRGRLPDRRRHRPVAGAAGSR